MPNTVYTSPPASCLIEESTRVKGVDDLEYDPIEMAMSSVGGNQTTLVRLGT